jgi:manganese/zinc/iron transport system permease protein
MQGFWIILTGILIAIPCALLGSFLVLRKMAMMGDAISHAVLPGIVIAFLITGSRDSVPMLIGAAAGGMLVSYMIELFHQKVKLNADAAIGVSYTFLFAVGVILVSLYGSQVDIDQDCVLYGEIAYVPLDLWITQTGLSLGPIQIWVSGILMILIIGLLVLTYRGWYLTSFDPIYAGAIGISTAFWNYLLMAAVSATTVVSFESVGAILVVAFLVGPPAAAYLISKQLKQMMLLSCLIACISVISGYFLAVEINSSIAAAISTFIGIYFALIFFAVKINKRVILMKALKL